MDKIYQAQLTAIKKNPTIINTVEINFNKFSLPPTIKSLDLLLPKILVFKVTAIQKSIFILKNFIKLYNNPPKINPNQIELIADGKVIAFNKGFINYNIII